MPSHVGVMALFSLFVSVTFGTLMRDEPVEQALLGAQLFGGFVLGGIALGWDRVAMLLAGASSIREVIAFPKTATGADPLTGAPAAVDEIQLRDLSVKSTVPPPAPPPIRSRSTSAWASAPMTSLSAVVSWRRSGRASPRCVPVRRPRSSRRSPRADNGRTNSPTCETSDTPACRTSRALKRRGERAPAAA